MRTSCEPGSLVFWPMQTDGTLSQSITLPVPITLDLLVNIVHSFLTYTERTKNQKKTEREKHKNQLKATKGLLDTITLKLAEYHLLVEDKKEKSQMIEREIKEYQEKREAEKK